MAEHSPLLTLIAGTTGIMVSSLPILNAQLNCFYMPLYIIRMAKHNNCTCAAAIIYKIYNSPLKYNI